MFGDAFGRFSQSHHFGDLDDSGSFTPSIDVQDEGDHYVVKVDLPGGDKSNVDVSCKDKELKISGSLDQIDELKEESDRGSLLRHERRSGRFSRTIPLPAPVEVDKMETEFDKGILTITIPKAEP
jgi:HSP20 family protein